MPRKRVNGKFVANTLADFWNYVDISGDCWEWQGERHRQGYGIFYLSNEDFYAHRIAYKLVYGNFDDKLKILHKCDNPPCCRPSHLFSGTQKHNVEDCKQKGRLNRAKGESNSQSKLTEGKVRMIKSSPLLPTKWFVKHFHVSKDTINKIKRNITWKHIQTGDTR